MGKLWSLLTNYLFFVPMLYEDFHLYLIESGFFIITHKYDDLNGSSTNFIIPYFKSLKTMYHDHLHELVRLFIVTRGRNSLNALNFYSRSCIVINNRSIIIPV